MAKLSKRAAAIAQKIDRTKLYPVAEALTLVKETAVAKFNESIDVAVQLGIDPKKSDQLVRGSVVLPAGTGKTVRVAVFAQGDKAEAAKAAGADIVGLDDLADQIKAGQMDFDVVIASPDTMRVVGALGQILGPRGLMPNPKVGTVTPDVATAVKNAKAGQVQYRTDKAGIIHATIGRASFGVEQLQTNLAALVDALQRLVPPLPRAFTCASWPFRPRWAAVRAWKLPRCRLPTKPTAVNVLWAASGFLRMLLSKTAGAGRWKHYPAAPLNPEARKVRIQRRRRPQEDFFTRRTRPGAAFG